MNALARIVHALVTGKETSGTQVAGLTAQEQMALLDMQPALQKPADVLQRDLDPDGAQHDWLNVTPSPESLPA